ncbi:MAG TPA: hypothetical protein VEC12_00970, partial [Bacteroidia bacterium]|nr:hypothetical protein [Bacteroidia bacterium]
MLVSALVALLIFQSGIVVFIIAALSFYQLISNFIHLLNSHTNSRESIIYFQGFFWLILTILLMFMVIPAGG